MRRIFFDVLDTGREFGVDMPVLESFRSFVEALTTEAAYDLDDSKEEATARAQCEGKAHDGETNRIQGSSRVGEIGCRGASRGRGFTGCDEVRPS